MTVDLEVDISDEFPWLRSEGLNGVKGAIEVHIIDVIYQTFICTADQDYVTSRLLALYGKDRDFFWSAAQCLEKYFKAILVSRGINVPDTHNISALFDRVKKQIPTFNSFEFDIDMESLVGEDYVKCMELFNIQKFINLINEQGTPHQRYNMSGYSFNISLVFHLDCFVAFTRQILASKAISESFVNSIHSHLLNVLFIQNAYFNNRKLDTCNITIKEFPKFSNVTNTKLDYLVRHKGTDQNCNYAFDWLDKKVKLPNSLKPKKAKPKNKRLK
ncbi:HEPN domain-containing protein [Psychromonas aquatilis]|uniref:HEPN domain-containing protein n=1 Tax=Psychromonas aquatilis TaxID=2005072 RepID=A0ABU9GNR9_9GAMM